MWDFEGYQVRVCSTWAETVLGTPWNNTDLSWFSPVAQRGVLTLSEDRSGRHSLGNGLLISEWLLQVFESHWAGRPVSQASDTAINIVFVPCEDLDGRRRFLENFNYFWYRACCQRDKCTACSCLRPTLILKSGSGVLFISAYCRKVVFFK